MADILDEVLNDTKYEKQFLLFRKSFPYIIAGAVIITLIIALYSWHNSRRQEYNQSNGDMLFSLLSGEYKDQEFIMESLEKLTKKGDSHISELSDLKMVQILSKAGKRKEAMERLEGIIDNKNYNDVTASFARLLWISMILDQKDLSEEVQMKARNYLQYFNDNKQPFFANATLLKALFYKKNKQNDLAKEYANTILNLETAPLSIKEQARAVEMSL